jgi:hypothetical protein
MLVDCGKSIMVDVRVDELSKQVMDHVVNIGLRNLLMDAHAGKQGEEAHTKVNNKLAAMYAGDIRVTSGPRGPKADLLNPAILGLAQSIVSARDVVELSKMSAKSRRVALQTRVREYIEANRAELRAKVERFLASDEPVAKGSVAKGPQRRAA